MANKPQAAVKSKWNPLVCGSCGEGELLPVRLERVVKVSKEEVAEGNDGSARMAEEFLKRAGGKAYLCPSCGRWNRAGELVLEREWVDGKGLWAGLGDEGKVEN